MTLSDTLIPCPSRPKGRTRPVSLGVACVLVALAIACGGGGGTERSAAEGTAAPPAEVRASSRSGPEGIEARALLGAKLYDDGRSAEAERVYRALLKQHPEHVGALVGLAQILMDRDDLDGAGAAIESALKANPQSIPALQTKIALLLARDQATEAVSLAETALRLDSKSPALQAALGDAQRSFGDLPKAIAAYRKAVVDPDLWGSGQLAAASARVGERGRAQP